MFKREESVIEENLMMLERENSRLLYRNEPLNERRELDTACVNTESIKQRGVLYAPEMENVQNTELVDQMIRDAVACSVDLVNLTRANPSFCAWF